MRNGESFSDSGSFPYDVGRLLAIPNYEGDNSHGFSNNLGCTEKNFRFLFVRSTNDDLEPTETMKAAAGRDHRRQPVVQTGAASSLGRQTDRPCGWVALTCEVGGCARLRPPFGRCPVLTHVVTVAALTIMRASADILPAHSFRSLLDLVRTLLNKPRLYQ
jgi:hypothetical protein